METTEEIVKDIIEGTSLLGTEVKFKITTTGLAVPNKMTTQEDTEISIKLAIQIIRVGTVDKKFNSTRIQLFAIIATNQIILIVFVSKRDVTVLKITHI